MSHPDVALTINTLGAMADELRAERDALKDAAKLALDASQKFVNKVDSGQAKSVETYLEMLLAIAALKAAL